MLSTYLALSLALAVPPLKVHDGDVPACLPLRELVIRSTHVVVATPFDPAYPEKFRVVEVLRGSLKRGAVVTPDASRYTLRSFDPPVPPETEPKSRRVALALLFLGPVPADGAAPLLPGGVRFCTTDERLLVPVVARKAGTLRSCYAVEIPPEATWPALLSQARKDSAAFEQLLARKSSPRPTERVRGLLDWVERHKREFGVPVAEMRGPTSVGWGDLEGEVFAWILAADCSLADAWETLRLQAEINRGELPRLPRPLFASRAGREFLTGLALRESALPADRARALRLLGDKATLGLAPGETATQPLTEKERDRIVEKLIPLLDREATGIGDASFRSAVAWALGRLSKPGGPLPSTESALKALRSSYQGEPAGASRDELARVVCSLASPASWKELTGNPPGVLACLRDFEHDGDKVRFWLDLQPGGAGRPVFEEPTLVLERVGTFGLIAETRKQPLAPRNLPRPWKEGWTAEEYLYTEIPTAGLPAGTWRVTVRGTVGKERAGWTSEPKRFVQAGTRP